MRCAIVRIVVGLLCWVVVIHCGAMAHSHAASRVSSHKIYMVLWRGMTDAERGFIRYVTENGIASRDALTIVDCQKDKSRLPGIVADIKAKKPSLVYTFGTTVTRAVAGPFDNRDPKRFITRIPVVFNIVSKPVLARIVEAFKKPGKNVTGVTHLVPLDSQIKAMQSVLPSKKIGVLYNPLEKNAVFQVNELKRMGKQFGFTLYRSALKNLTTGTMSDAVLENAVDRLARQKPEWIFLPSDSLLISNSRTIVARAHHHRIPTFSATESPIRKGGAVMGLVSNYSNAGQFAAYKAQQILENGMRPADIPVEPLSAFSFVINMAGARELGVYPPLGIFQFAEVINPLPGGRQ